MATSSTNTTTQTTPPATTTTAADGRTTHPAQCHCGLVTYSVTLPKPFPEAKVNRCNCSICFAHGYELVYPCRRDVVFYSGYDTLGTYQFNTKKKEHKFCKTCGSTILIDFLRPEGTENPEKDILAMNVRMFKDIDLEKMEWTTFDGKRLL